MDLITFTLAALFAIVVWAVRLEGRVNGLHLMQDGLKELLSSRFDEIDSRLDRIERSMNGHLHRDLD